MAQDPNKQTGGPASGNASANGANPGGTPVRHDRFTAVPSGRPRRRSLPAEVYGRTSQREESPAHQDGYAGEPAAGDASVAYGGIASRNERLEAYGRDNPPPEDDSYDQHGPDGLDESAEADGPAHRRPRALRVGLKIGGVLLVFIISLLALAFGAITVVCKGPFPTAREMFVVSVEETSAVKFLSRIYFTEDEVQAILQKNTVIELTEVTDVTVPFQPPAPDETVEDIEIIEISGSTFRGKLMLIRDPSRVRLAAIPQFGKDVSGRRIEDFAADSGAIAAINAGGFADDGGVGKGGQPLGLLIQDGVIRSGSASTKCNVIGLSYDHQLIVGEMTGQEALDLGVRDAVHFTPTLIVNGKAAEVSGTGGGVNPRTCIGQRADGTIMFLVIDGRQPSSIGATLQDCIDLMLEYEAVNAANLDGGSSSVMVYEGEIINVCSSLYGSRTQPAAFIVER